ncbi:helix-turn-helix domain-containing protein [Micromonospora inaquosa]|uniref:HTH cro/C1-type domain-containing protein n=1 Tax=Micromonospora inaquosa TaxID=2203716 RepID=A0A3N9W0N3_9ACTN|nr:hypothetical protein DLJ59_34585 [Micromonospora inaquosa]
MTSSEAAADAMPGEIVRRRLREVRRRRKLNATEAAEMFGDPTMSATVLMNIEAGRRQTEPTVDELIRFAYILDVPPAALLMAEGGQVQVAPGVTVDPGRFRRWVLGQEPLDGVDEARYRAAAKLLNDDDQSVAPELREEFLSKAQVAFDAFFADSEEIRRKTRQQVRGVLGEIREAVVSGTEPAELAAKIDEFLNRLG